MNAPCLPDALAPPPHSIEAEHSVLGGLMLDNQALARIQNLRAEHFYRDDHRRIFRHITQLLEEGKAADVVTVYESIEQSNEVDQTGGLGYLGEIANATPSVANIRHYAEIVVERARARQVQAIGNALVVAGGSQQAAALALLSLDALGGDDRRVWPAPLGWSDAGAKPTQPTFIFGPLQAGDVGLIAGADGLGKSWLALLAGASVAAGVGLGGVFPSPVAGRVLYLAGEDRRADHQRRLHRLGEYMQAECRINPRALDDNFRVQPLEGQRMPLLEQTRDGTYAFTQWARAFKKVTAGYQFVIIDPFRMFHDLPEVDGVGMDKLVRWLVTVAMQNQQAVLVVHHVSQSAMLDGREDHHSGRGATDFPGGCRGVWVLRGMSPAEAKSAGISDEDRRDWRCLVNGKASHTLEAGRVWLNRRSGGLLVKSGYTPEEMADASVSGGKRRRGRDGI